MAREIEKSTLSDAWRKVSAEMAEEVPGPEQQVPQRDRMNQKVDELVSAAERVREDSNSLADRLVGEVQSDEKGIGGTSAGPGMIPQWLDRLEVLESFLRGISSDLDRIGREM